MEKTEHTLLVGEWATQFAIQMGFQEENLTTSESEDIWKEWQDEKCQPNFWKVWIELFYIKTHKNGKQYIDSRKLGAH